MSVRVSLLKDYRPPAEICRERGWMPGTCLEGDEGYGPSVIRITAIGECSILAKMLTHQGRPYEQSEGLWDLSCREWREVQDPTDLGRSALSETIGEGGE